MAYFAQLDENNIVTQVIVISDNVIKDFEGNEVEQLGIDFCKELVGSETHWVQTKDDGKFRVRYADIGYSYDEKLDAFIPPKPFDSWVLNEETADWVSPVGLAPELTEEEIEARSFYRWDEENQEWVLETPPEPEEE